MRGSNCGTTAVALAVTAAIALAAAVTVIYTRTRYCAKLAHFSIFDCAHQALTALTDA
jgi:hypothetical protein